MKKILLTLLALTLCFTLAACASDTPGAETEETIELPPNPLTFQPNANADSEGREALQQELNGVQDVAELLTFQSRSNLIFTNSFEDRDGRVIVVVGLFDEEFDNEIIELWSQSEVEHIIVDLRAIANKPVSAVEVNFYSDISVGLDVVLDTSISDMEPFVQMEESPENSVEAASTVSEADLTFGSTFIHRDFEIEIGDENDTIWLTVENSRNDYYGNAVAGIPVTITNLSGETGRLNLFSYTFFGPNGTQLSNVIGHRDYDIWSQGDMRPEASQQGYFLLMYDGDGTYFIEFSRPDLEVVLPIVRPN